MSEIKRYSLYCTDEPTMMENPLGDYVRFFDYQQATAAASAERANTIEANSALDCYLLVAEEDKAKLEKRIAELEQENAKLHAALKTPEVYAGVVSRVLEDERDAAVRRCEQVDGILRRCGCYIGATLTMYDREQASRLKHEIDKALTPTPAPAAQEQQKDRHAE